MKTIDENLLNEIKEMYRRWIMNQEYINTISSEKAFVAGCLAMIDLEAKGKESELDQPLKALIRRQQES